MKNAYRYCADCGVSHAARMFMRIEKDGAKREVCMDQWRREQPKKRGGWGTMRKRKVNQY